LLPLPLLTPPVLPPQPPNRFHPSLQYTPHFDLLAQTSLVRYNPPS
jgi:hypothetical protein